MLGHTLLPALERVGGAARRSATVFQARQRLKPCKNEKHFGKFQARSLRIPRQLLFCLTAVAQVLPPWNSRPISLVHEHVTEELRHRIRSVGLLRWKVLCVFVRRAVGLVLAGGRSADACHCICLHLFLRFHRDLLASLIT